MFQTVARSVAGRAPAIASRRAQARFISIAPPHQKPRSWKSSAVRWAIAGAGLYYYSTSTLFADEPPELGPHATQDSEHLPTLDSYTPSSRRKADSSSMQLVGNDRQILEQDSAQAAEELEEDAHSQGAFNEETGEINWDCPCLGGMAHGPCGPEFREAFSCFVYSKEEPKGMDCIDRFKGMQDCFRQHPDIYQAELEDDDDDEEEGAALQDDGVKVTSAQTEDAPSVAAAVKDAEDAKSASSRNLKPQESRPTSPDRSDQDSKVVQQANEDSAKQTSHRDSANTMARTQDSSRSQKSDTSGAAKAFSEIEGDLVPKQAHDARDASSK